MKTILHKRWFYYLLGSVIGIGVPELIKPGGHGYAGIGVCCACLLVALAEKKKLILSREEELRPTILSITKSDDSNRT